MKIEISEHQLPLEYGGDLVVRDNQSDDGDIQISVAVGGCSMSVDMSIDKLGQLRHVLREAYDEAFKVQPGIKCPACGYTKEEAMYFGDHQTCRRFPFFPGERGKTHAIG